jgi:small conductance mechanosensitive channel
VNIAPVIASLGVVGLAAGIGAQTIIKDVVAGIVMLFEDIVAVGDWVDLEYAEGTVESINLRATQVRGVDGVLWTVRNGEIIRVGNYARGFSNAVVTLDIDAGADDAKVSEVLEQVTAELTADPRWQEPILADAEISGILSVDGNRYQRRVVIQTVPGQQWGVERELRARIRAGFAAAHLSFAMPRFVEAAQ